jgi:hypothetical protein
MDEVPDPRKPGGKKWRLGKWIKHLKRHDMLNMRSLEKGGFPSVYVHWMSKTAEQSEFLETLDPYDWHNFFNMYTFTHEQDCIMFKLKGA